MITQGGIYFEDDDLHCVTQSAQNDILINALLSGSARIGSIEILSTVKLTTPLSN
jgi:hypothetical protein